MSVSGAQARITEAVTAWANVTVQPHRFGGVEYVIGKREIGHIHGITWWIFRSQKKCVMKLSLPSAHSLIIFCQRRAG